MKNLLKHLRKSMVALITGLTCIAVFVPMVVVFATKTYHRDDLPTNPNLNATLGEHHNIVVAAATVPVNQAALYLWEDEDTLAGRTHFWYARRDTFDNIQAIGERFNLIGRAGIDQMIGSPSGEMDTIAKLALDIYNQNNNNTFTLFVVDYSLEAILKVIYRNRIPMCNFVRIVILEDGGANIIRHLAGGPDGGARLDAKLDLLNNRIRQAHNGRVALSGSPQRWFSYMAALATFPNVEFWTNPASVQAAANTIASGVVLRPLQPEVLARFNLTPMGPGGNVTMNLVNRFFAENDDAARVSFKNAMFGTAVQDALYSENGRPNLVITGTWFGPEQDIWYGAATGYTYDLTAPAFEIILNQIVEVYGQDYNLVYKGHPAFPITEGWESSNQWRTNPRGSREAFDRRVAFIEEVQQRDGVSLTMIPCQIPMDMIMLFFTDVTLNVGGFDSSLFLAADRTQNYTTPHRVVFFIAGGERGIGVGNLDVLDRGGFSQGGDREVILEGEQFYTPGQTRYRIVTEGQTGPGNVNTNGNPFFIHPGSLANLRDLAIAAGHILP